MSKSEDAIIRFKENLSFFKSLKFLKMQIYFSDIRIISIKTESFLENPKTDMRKNSDDF
jgi:hypothetical protein